MLRWLALAALVAAGCASAADAQEYDSSKDFDTLAAGNTNVAGIWSDGTTMWVADHGDDKLFAYHMSNMSRYLDNDFPLHTDNTDPYGIWSDGTTMWVSDFGDDKLFAYHMSNMSRYSTSDFALDAGNTAPVGIWSDGTTMWVVDQTASKIFAYHMSNMSRNQSQEFDSGETGLWSDGTTMWVPLSADNKIYAYNLASKERVGTKDFDMLAAGNTALVDLWSDGTTMWVADSDDDKIYAYKCTGCAVQTPTTPTTPAVSPPRVFVYIPPPDTTPPTVKSVERTGNATTTNHALTWEVTFSERVVLRTNIHANYTQHFHALTLPNIHTNYTSVANATIPDLGMAYDAMLVDVPGIATGGSVSVDIHHPITSGLLIELVTPDCTRFVVHNQTTTFLYKLRQPYDLGDLDGVGAAGQWTLHVSDHAKYWNGTLNGWTLELESEGAVEGGGRTYTITQYVAGPGDYTLSLDGYTIWDRAGNRLVDTDPAVNEPYHVVGAAARACHTE